METTRAGTRRPPAGSTRIRILDVAMATFAAKGFDASSMQQIADAIGISKPAIYKHFSTKEALLVEVLEVGHHRSTALMEEIFTLDALPIERLREYVRRHVVWYLTNLDLFHVGVQDWTSLGAAAMSIELPKRRRYQQFLRDLVVACQDNGSADPDVDPKYAAAYIRGAVNSAHTWYRPDGPDSVESIADSIAELSVVTITRSHAPIAWDSTASETLADETGDRFDELVKATMHVFCEKGYSATSIQDIAEQVGLLKGSVYHYIDSKYDLLLKIFETAHLQLNEIIGSVAAMTESPQARLRAIFELQTRWLLDNFEQSAVLFHEWSYLAPVDRDRVTERRKVLEGFIRELVGDCAAAGLLRPGLDVTRAMRFVLGAIYASPEWYRPDGRDPSGKLAAAFAEFTVPVFLNDPSR